MSLRHAILGFLSLKPLTGYDLKKAIDQSVRHFWTADQAQIYRALTQLEEDGLVRVERIHQTERPDRKVHHLTPQGGEELDRWLLLPLERAVTRDPFLIKLFFSARLTPEQRRALVAQELHAVEEQLGELAAVAKAFEPRVQAAPPEQVLGPVLTLANGLAMGRAYLAWLRQVAQAVEGKQTVSALWQKLMRDAG